MTTKDSTKITYSHEAYLLNKVRLKSSPLTPTELRILYLVCEGFTNQGIASKVVISQKTVEHHVNQIMSKLECHNSRQLIPKAYKLGLVPIPQPNPAPELAQLASLIQEADEILLRLKASYIPLKLFAEEVTGVKNGS